MNKAELVSAMAKRANLPQRDAERALEAFLETLGNTLRSGDKIQLVGYGTFEVRERAATTARNPRTGETIEVAAKKVPAFKAGKALKEAVDSKDAVDGKDAVDSKEATK